MSSIEELDERVEALEELFEQLAAKVDYLPSQVKTKPKPQIWGNPDDEWDRTLKLAGQWIKERCVRDPDAFTPWVDLYDDFADYCREQKRSLFMTHTSARLAQIMRAHNLKRHRTASQRGYLGVRLADVVSQVS